MFGADAASKTTPNEEGEAFNCIYARNRDCFKKFIGAGRTLWVSLMLEAFYFFALFC